MAGTKMQNRAEKALHLSHPGVRPGAPDPVATAEEARLSLRATLDPTRRSMYGQFFTPPATARLMASMSTLVRNRVRLLDAGAGVGALTAAWVAEICSRPDLR